MSNAVPAPTVKEVGQKALYRITEIMVVLSMRRTMIDEQLRSGRLRAVKQGRTRLVPATAVTDYVALLEHPVRAALARPAYLPRPALRTDPSPAPDRPARRTAPPRRPSRPARPAGPAETRRLAGLPRRRWPTTANPHLFIHYKTATHTGPARPWWICKKLGMPAQAIRQDRILDEAIATAGDARRLTDLFGLSITQAARYTTAAGHTAMANFERRDR